MRICGIDTGPHGFAWATYDSLANKVDLWGECQFDPDDERVMLIGYERFPMNGIDALAVERISRGGYGNVVDAAVFRSCEVVGMVRLWAGQLQMPLAVMARPTIAAAITGSSKSGDAEINRALGRLVPSFAAVRRGLNGHHRSAAAVAYVGVGRVKL